MTDKHIITKSQMIMRIAELSANLEVKEQECERLKYDNAYEVGALETIIDNLKTELEQEKTLKEMYFTYYKAKHSDIKGEFFKLKAEQAEVKKYLGISHKTILEQLEELTDFRDRDREQLDQLKAENERLKKTLKELISEVEDES